MIVKDITINNIINKFKELNDVEAYFGKLPDGVEEPNMLFLIPKIVVQSGKSSNKLFSYDMKIRLSESDLAAAYEKGVGILDKIDVKSFPVRITTLELGEEESQIMINMSFLEERVSQQQEGTKIGKISFDTKIK